MAVEKQAHNVLVIDDDVAIRAMLHELLEDEGYQVHSARNGREALQTLRDRVVEPCVILLDLNMPIMTGWEFRAEQQRDPMISAIPVIVISADRSLEENSTPIDAVAYFPKPIDLRGLLQQVAQQCA